MIKRLLNCFALLILLALPSLADELRPREDGRIVLRLGGLPSPGDREWEEYGRFLELNPDGLVPPHVQQHIEHHGLYSSTMPGRRRSDAPRMPAAGRLHGED